MAESSSYWGGTALGDCGPYTDDAFSDIWRKLFGFDRTIEGIIPNYANTLATTNPAANTARVATGAALVDGKFYESTADVDVNIPTPGGATRIDRIVLRKSWAAQTVRITRIAGAEGGGVPALTQTDGTTWDVPIAQVSITIAGAITLTDDRYYCRHATHAPSVRVRRSTNQTITTATTTAVSFDVETFDTDQMWVSTAPTRITARTAGKYWLAAGMVWSGATGPWTLRIRLNGATILADHQLPDGTSPTMLVNTLYALAAGDYVEMIVSHTAGTDRDVFSDSVRTPWFSAALVGN